jgi:membrane-associated phospholipid phosphatase
VNRLSNQTILTARVAGFCVLLLSSCAFAQAPQATTVAPVAKPQVAAAHGLTQLRPFGVWDYAGTAAALGLLYLVEALPGPSSADWDGPILLDKPVRSWLVADSRQGRAQADSLSDVLWYASLAYPTLSAFAVPLARGAGFETSWQLTMMNAQAFAVSSMITRLSHRVIGRSRPNAIGCRRDPDYSDQCGKPQQLASFFSGHQALSMTGAGLACAHHLHGHLFGNAHADAVGCGAAIAVAQLVGIMRMRADKHWLSDTLMGTLVGFGVGYGLPTLLHYHPFWRKARGSHTSSAQDSQGARSGAVSVMPLVVPQATTLTVTAVF